MNCPRCTQSLERIDLGRFGGEYPDIEVDVCGRCNGTWYDKGELDLRDESVWTNAERLDFAVISEAAPASCPRCRVPMEPVSPKRLPHVVLGRCRSCEGFWLDAGNLEEVQRLAAQLDSQKMRALSRAPSPIGGDHSAILVLALMLAAD